ncbi:uncharacterized protein [Garra rufa]|uniref:uncharacterized protein n=1 Tax=Garra rufa TaxID=137080 RepID=UPI003CCE5529
MAFIKDESEDMKIEETLVVKREDTEEQTKKVFIKEESEDMKTEETLVVKQEDTEEQTGQPDMDRRVIPSPADIVRTVPTNADHGYKCYVPGCAGDVTTFHSLPTEKSCKQAWLMFIYNRIPKHFNSKLLVCSAHFTMDSFSNLGQYQAGFAQRLMLKKGMVPTIFPLQPLPQATTSQLQRTSDVGCQTDDPIVFSKGTQLSLKTLRSHLRSKGVQVSSTTEMSLPTINPVTSTTVKASRPAKRPRVELEEDIEMEVVSSADPYPQCHISAIA